ncbi:hypothetical protein CLAFUW4_10618 [Fulvia fulva]|nr:hypothetical protein CLAFUR4_10623 [Fulvia fulva]WPV18933.1 hypothetical protein CLAFUW4_10618 [Fulvia fulva]WPV33993.1 hypothetical protein CLAFUW7_10620 [Fulvia fulva]
MPAFQIFQQATGYDFEELKTALKMLAVEDAASVDASITTVPVSPHTTAEQKKEREVKFEAAAARLHDICLQRKKFDKLYDSNVVVEVSTDTLEHVEVVVISGAQHSVSNGKGAVGTGPLPEASGMAKEEAKRVSIRAKQNFYNICLAQATEARHQLDSAVQGAIKNQDADSEATTSIESGEESGSDEEPETTMEMFMGKVDAVSELPSKKSEDRKQFWNDLIINDLLLMKDTDEGKQGTYSLRLLPRLPVVSVAFDKEKIRPVVTVTIDNEDDADYLAGQALENGHQMYFTTPAIPTHLKFINSCTSPNFPEFKNIKAEVEIAPAHWRDIAVCAGVLLGESKRPDVETKQTWKATTSPVAIEEAVSSGIYNAATLPRAVRLMRTNAVFTRV